MAIKPFEVNRIQFANPNPLVQLDGSLSGFTNTQEKNLLVHLKKQLAKLGGSAT